jgi:MFS family permease
MAGAVWPPILRYLTDAYGWRQAFFIYAVIALVMLLPLSLILRAPPRASTGAVRRSGHGGGRVLGWPAGAVVAMLCLAIVGCCVAMAMPMVHLIAYATDLGHPSARAAEMLAALLAGAVVSRLLFGALADRIGGLWTLLIGSAGQLLMLSSFTLVESLLGLYVIAALFGLVYGGIVPCYAIIVRELFPLRQVGSRIGIVFLFGTVGMALGGWLGGQIFDLTGSYDPAFLVGVVFNLGNLALVGALLLRQGWRVPRPAAA